MPLDRSGGKGNNACKNDNVKHSDSNFIYICYILQNTK